MLPQRDAVICFADLPLRRWLHTVLSIDGVEVSAVASLGRVMELASGRGRDLFVLDGREPGIENVLALLAAAQSGARVLVFGDDAVHERDPRVLRLPWSTDPVDFLAPIRRALAAPSLEPDERSERTPIRARRISESRPIAASVGVRPPREGHEDHIDVARINGMRARPRQAG